MAVMMRIISESVTFDGVRADGSNATSHEVQVVAGIRYQKCGLRELEAQHAKRRDGGRVCGTRERRRSMDLGKDGDQNTVVVMKRLSAAMTGNVAIPRVFQIENNNFELRHMNRSPLWNTLGMTKFS